MLLPTLAAVTWQEIGGGLGAMIAVLTGGVVAKDKIQARRASRAAEDEPEGSKMVTQRECDLMHQSLRELLDERHENMKSRLDDLQGVVTSGFAKIQGSIDAIRK